mgnify:FL=1
MPASVFPVPLCGKKQRKRLRSGRRRQRRRQLGFETLELRRVLASIAGQVVYDLDGDGALETYEPGLPDWQIYIDTNNNEQYDEGEPTVLTDANGEYQLGDLAPGFYTLRRVPQAGWQQTFPGGIGKHTVNLRNATQEIVGIDFAQQRLFTPLTPGNLLITRSSFVDNDLLLEYTPDGQMVQALVIPGTTDASRLIAKDLVLDGLGQVQIFNGYDDVRLTTFNPITATFADTLVPEWDMGRTFDPWGDIAAFGNYVFANEHLADGGTADGVIRFDARDLSFQRFSGGFGVPTDLTVGLDGLLYTLNATVNNTTVLVHNPETMSLVRAVNVDQRLQSIAVDEDGNLYAVTDTGLKQYTADGEFVKGEPAVNGLDIAISRDQRLVVTTDVRVTLLDTDFANRTSFLLPGSVAENFLSFAAFVQEPAGEVPAGSGIDYGVLQPGNILVANSPETGEAAKLFEYTPFGELVQEYDLPTFEPGGARDLVTDALGNVQIFNGTLAPRLTAFDSQAGGFVPEQVQFAGWSSADLPTGGGLASYRNYVYATDMKTQNDTLAERGIVRYNLATETFERFHSQHGDLVDLNVGLDGLLYTLAPAREWSAAVTSFMTLAAGVSGDLASLAEDDGDELSLRPYSAYHGFEIITRFDSVPNIPLTAVVRGWYEGVPEHNVTLEILNARSGRWQRVTGALQDFPAAAGEQTYVFALPRDLTEFISGGNLGTLNLRIADPTPGAATHRMHLDQLILQGGTVVRQYNPVTMDLLKTVTLPGSHRALAVDANGDLFAAGPEIYRYTKDAVPVGSPLKVGTIGPLCDLDLDADGRLLAAASDGQILVTDRDFTSLVSFQASASDGMNFAAFVSPDRPLPKARPDRFTVQQGSSENILDVLANDNVSALGVLSITAVGTPTQGGSVTVVGTSQLSYAPAQDPAFVGVETFTYTISDGMGGTAQGVVQLAVQGNGNYFVFDDRYATTEDDLLPLTVPAASGVLVNDGRPDIFPVLTPGNFLVAHSPTGSNPFSLLQEYTRSGVLVRSIELPSFTGDSADVRDLVVDRQGNIQVYNGTSQPRLSTYDPVTETLTQTTFANWNTAEEKTGGGLAAWRNFVFATDQLMSAEDPQSDAGIIRFDLETGTSRRFVDGGNLIDLTVSPDGSLYALGPGGAVSSRFIRVYDPLTMTPVRQILNLPADLRAITVAANGDIYGVRSLSNPYVYRYNANGALVDQYRVYAEPGVPLPDAEADFSDIDLSEDGRTLLIANINQSSSTATGDGDVVLFDLLTRSSSILQAPDESSDMKFVAWVQAPVATVNGPLTVVSSTPPAHGVLDCNLADTTLDGVKPDGSFCYVPEPGFSGVDGFTYVVSDADGKLREGSVTLTVAPRNDPPELTPAASTLESDEDAVLGFPLTALINGGAGTTAVSDPDVHDPLGGIAVTGLTGPGVWSFSQDGVGFVDIGTVSQTDALLLPSWADIRFTPFGGSGGTATFTYAAWDQTLGTAGTRTPVTYLSCTAGGLPDPETGLCSDDNPPEELAYGAFSQDVDQKLVTDALAITLLDFNDAPVLIPGNPQLGTTDEHTPLDVTVGSFVTGVSDPDGSGQLQGIVVVSASGAGLWEYSAAGGAYQPLLPVTAGQALVLGPDSRLRYTPDDRNGEVATVTYRAWDATDGASVGYRVDASVSGGSSAYSGATDSGWIEVTDVNDAPVLAPQSPAIGTTDVVTPFEVALPEFVGGITDLDHNAVTGGIAVFGVTGQGVWSYALNGTTFVEFPALSATSALLLSRTATIRYAPAGGTPETATMAYHAWDASQGLSGGIADVTVNGTDTAFSVATDVATLTIKEVNDPPTLGGADDPVTYTENDPPTAILPGGTVVDPDSADFADGRLVATIVAGGTPNDRLLIQEGNGISLAGDTVIYDGGVLRLIGNYTIDGWVLTVHFTSVEATKAAVQAVLRSIAYENVSENPTATDRRVQVSLTDGDGGNDTGALTQTVAVRPVNDPPSAQGDQYDTPLGQSLTVNRAEGVLANDVDFEGTELTAVLTEPPLNGELTLLDDGSLTYVPDALYYGQDAFSYKAWDGEFFSDTVRVVIDVRLRPTNPAHPADVNADGYLSPLDAVLIANFLLHHGAGPLPAQYEPPPFVDYDGDGSATQADADLAAADLDVGGTRPVPPPRLVLPQTPDSPGPGNLARVTLQTTDAAGAPIASVNAGQTFYLEAWVSDRRLDPWGVAAAYVDVGYPTSLVSVTGAVAAGAEFPHFVAGQTSTAGSIEQAGAGRITSLPDGQEHRLWRAPMSALGRGEAVFTADGADNLPAGQFLLFGLDGPLDGAVNVEYLGTTLQIKGPPVAADDQYEVVEDGELTATVGEGVLANDDDEEHDPLTAVLVDPPAHGALQFSPAGSFVYTPDPDFFGTDRFSYRANDGFFNSNLATVTLTVAAVNDDPVAAADSYSVFRNQALSVAAADGVLANDRDADDDPLTARLVQSPLHGTLTLRADGSFDYTPATDYGGPDAFTYRAFDGTTESDETAVELQVFFDWQNPFHPVDVNGDGYASPIDALLSFNDFATHGIRILPDPPVPPDVAPPFLDFNGDGLSSDFDGKRVLADLNANGSRLLSEPRLELPQPVPPLGDEPLVRLRVEAVNAQGEAVSTVSLGETFVLNVYAADLRPAGTGVFSAYLDVIYDQAGLAATGPIQFGADFPNVRTGSTASAGLLDEAGAVATATAPAAAEALLLQVALTATASGQFSIAAEPADLSPAGQVTLYGIDGPIPAENIEYGTIQVTVIREDSDGDGVRDFEEDGAPYGGDGNQDGIADRLQPHVASLRSSADGPYVTMAAAPQVTLTNVTAVANPAPDTSPSNVGFPLGFFRLDAGGVAAGAAATLTVYAEPGTVINTYYGYGSTPDHTAPHWYPFLFDGVTGAKVLTDRIELHLADGQRGDGDPTPSRIAFGPGGAGLSPTAWTNPLNRFDVNASGSVTAADPLVLINLLNLSGPQELPPVPAAGDMLPPYRDTNWDNRLEALDVLNIINFLNGPAGGEGEWAGVYEAASNWALPAAAELTGGTPAETSQQLATARRAGRLSGHAWTSRGGPDAPVQADEPARLRRGPGAALGAGPGQATCLRFEDALDFDRTLDEIALDVAQNWGA